MANEMYGMSDLVKATGISKHRIVYALERGVIPEPRRLAGRRCFSAIDIDWIKRWFETTGKTKAGR